MASLKDKAISMAKGNDGKHKPGEAKKFLDRAQDMKNDGKLNGNDKDSKAEKKDMKDGKLNKSASLVEIARSL